LTDNESEEQLDDDDEEIQPQIPPNADEEEIDELANDDGDELAEIKYVADVQDEAANPSDEEMAEFMDEGEQWYPDNEIEDN
jgi:uncharacterized protein YchJ